MSSIRKNNNSTKVKGIQISKGYENNNLSENKIFMWFVKVLIIFMGTFGALYSFVSGYELDYSIEFFITSSLLCALLFGTLYIFKRIAVCVFPASCLLLLIIGYINNDQLYSFFIYTWNECVDFLASKDLLFPKFSTLGTQMFNEVFIWTFVSLVFSVIIGFFTVFKIHFLPVFVMTFVPLELVLYFGLVPNLFSVICFFACNAAVLSMSVIKIKKKYFENSKFSQRGLAVVSLIMCIFFAAALCLSNWGIAISGYERPEEFNIIRKNYSNFNFKSLLSDKNELIDLSNQSKRETDMEEDLLINIPLETNSVYLKFRTGSIYENNKWFDFDSSVYNETPINIMKSNNLTISDIFATSEQGKRSLGLMTIKPVMDISGFTYLPYGFYNDGGLTAVNDEGAIKNQSKSKMLKGYSVSYDRRANNLWGELQDDQYFLRKSQFLEISGSYTDFVNDHYTQVPDNLTKLKELAEDLKNDGFQKRAYIINSIKKVQNYLRENAEYSLEPGAVPNGKDFTEHFLFENKKGFCVHFATAGVMLLRAMGIPSRYASGYIITDDDFANASDVKFEKVKVTYLENQKTVSSTVDQNTATVSLTDKNAHAWAEVYVDGLGWIPCEMTTGYSQSESGLGDLNYGDVQNETKSETEAETEATTQETTEAETEEPETFSNIPDDSQTTDASGIGLDILLIIIAIIILIVAVDLILRAIIVRKRLKSFKGRNLNKNAENLYLYLEKILLYSKFKDLQKDNLTIGFEKLFKKFDFVDDKQSKDTVEVLQKLFYGNVNISKEELIIVEKFVLSFVSNFISLQKRRKRFVYKYILFLA